MHIKRLRLLGFKSFVDPTELIIEQGLTGVVGPNGCGKSNLLEALRWVMGETSYKSMRASAMDDVIFSGSHNRPSRNSAEVTIFLDNSDRKAPAHLNDSDVLEVTRRIEREAGSAYRINGQEARARDIKILFEDAATGARSPALVRQGQISELVNAKPTDRRRILEDAAGIAGLHSRRHEAELRLKAADANLARVRDVLGQLNSQVESLKRQARAARRYKEISGEIRTLEAISLHLEWAAAEGQVQTEEGALGQSLEVLAGAVDRESRATRSEAEMASGLQPLREAEAERGAALARLKHENERYEAEERQAIARRDDLEQRLRQLEADLAREAKLVAEAEETLARLAEEEKSLAAAATAHEAEEASAKKLLADCQSELSEADSSLAMAQQALAEDRARRRSLEQSAAEQARLSAKLDEELKRIDAETEELSRRSKGLAKVAAVAASLADMGQRVSEVEAAAIEAEHKASQAGETARLKREAASRTSLRAGQLATEVQTLKKLLTVAADERFPPIVDSLKVAPGCEIALGAALGDDLVAPIDAESPLHWKRVDVLEGDPPLPEGATALADFVEAPPELARRLKQIGIVARPDGERLQKELRPGQRLVTREGDLWRWDGFVAAAHAPTAAAQRLAERNRLASLEIEEERTRRAAEAAHGELEAAIAAHKAAETAERELRSDWRQIQAAMAKTREELTEAEKSARETRERLAALGEARARTAQSLEGARRQQEAFAHELSTLPDLGGLEGRLKAQADFVAGLRSRFAEARAAEAGLERERQARQARGTEIGRERERWQTRTASARSQIAALEERRAATETEAQSARALPGMIAERRGALASEVVKTEKQRGEAADRLSEAETALRLAQSQLRQCQTDVADAREGKARIEARLESARERRTRQAHVIEEAFQCAPAACLGAVGLTADAQLPTAADCERQLARLKGDRERLGGVNLGADEELEKASTEFMTLDKERADLEEAIEKLKGGIAQLNKEGRKRLAEAFDTVNGHFQRLFTALFNGGEARLEMIESEDPLEGGLEIIAKPPGKKPNTISLLSGGEQTLTALSLIFAVFLTNPSPICVLDEVDAPLDDANVDRFCTLMEKMSSDTATRFLVITHHPMTMARMDRLFGVTMAEKGVSQLVSVDLAAAERYREAV